MGFFKRLLGGTDPQQVELSVTSLDDTRHDAVVHVVGEVYRQGLVASARPPGADELPPGLRAPSPGLYKAILMREPENKHDPNAIRAMLWAGRTWAMVGYLSRENALAYQPVFPLLAARYGADAGTPTLACDAALIPEREGTGVVLHLGTPGEVVVQLWFDLHPPSDHRWSGRLVAFTGADRTALASASLDRHAQRLLATKAGCLFAPRVTKKVEALIAADEREVTGNLTKARDYGIPIVPEVDFLRGIGVEEAAITRTAGTWVRG